NDGELNIKAYTGVPLVYVASKDPLSPLNIDADKKKSTWKELQELQDANEKSSENILGAEINEKPNDNILGMGIGEKSNDNILEEDACILFPIAEVTYSSKYLKDFHNITNDYTEYGQFFANKLLVGGKLVLKNFANAKPKQHEHLKSHLVWAFDASCSNKENPIEGATIYDFPIIETTNEDKIKTPKDLARWMKRLYEDNAAEIISYEEVVPIYALIEKLEDKSIRFTKRLVPGITHKHKEFTLKDWTNDTPSTNLLTWINKFNFHYGVLVDQFRFSFAKKCAINFIQGPIVTKLNLSYLQTIRPKTLIEETLLKHDVISKLDPIPFVTIAERTTSQISNIKYFFVRQEIVKISLETYDCIKASSDFEQAVKDALDNIKPYQKLQQVFNDFGHFLPQTIILGRQLKEMLPNPMKSDSPDDDKIQIVASSQDDIDEAFEQIKESNCKNLLGSDGKIRKQNKIYDWLKLNENDDKLVDNIRIQNIRPLYEILEEELRHEVEIIWKNRLDNRILLTGFTNISKDNLTEVNFTEAHIRIDFKDRLDDNCFHVFGHVVNDDHDKLEGIVVRFDLFDYYGFSAFVTFNQ
ncbi:6683_t:CDS:1, partial [Racocetra fulgida]